MRCHGFFGRNEKWVHCSRNEYAGRARLNAHCATYSHRLNGPCDCGKEHNPLDVTVAHRNGKPKADGACKIHATFDAAVDAVCAGLTATTMTTWIYPDLDGKAAMVVARFDLPDGGKAYRPFHPVTSGWSIGDPPGKLPLYNLHELAEASRVYFVEGEKSVELIRPLGLVATTSAHGAQSPGKTDMQPLAGKEVVLIPDNDVAGEEYVRRVTALLTALKPQAVIKVLRLPLRSTGDDIEQWLQDVVPDMWTDVECRAELERLANETLPFTATMEVTRQEVPESEGGATNDQDEPGQTPAADDDLFDDADLDARLARFHQTDLGNARRFVARHGADIRYCHNWSKWLVFDGRQWRLDDTGAIQRLTKDTIQKIDLEVASIHDPKERKKLQEWRLFSEKRSYMEAMLAVAASELGVPVRPNELDADPWLLNVQNGTINLRTGELRPHRREDLITNLAPVDYDPAATCPLWISTLDRIFAGNADLIRFWQQLCGISLTGTVIEQILPILYGAGANGKSTILNVLLEILGPGYALMAPPGLLVIKRGEAHPTERAVLYGKRLVIDVESAEGARLNENLVKQLTGSDRITARRMREDFWEFAPTHTLLLCTNHRPEIRETKNAIWRRIRLVPFTVVIPESEQIKDLPARLRAEYQGILAWCVRGCLDWQTHGLAVPDEVTTATAEYRHDQDLIGSFISEECTVLPQLRAKASQLYERYRAWIERCGEVPVTQKAFGSAMTERGFERFTSNGRWYLGVALSSTGVDDSSNRY